MVNGFSFSPTPSVFFGAGKRKELPRILQNYGKKGLIVTGAGLFRKSASGSRFLEEVEQSVEELWFATIPGEPTPEMVDGIVAGHRHRKLDFVIAIGGGSVLDGGKAVSAMLQKNESVVEFLEGVGNRAPDGSKIPFIAVPTTAGTGSETTKNAVISRIGANGFKKSLRHDNYIPNVALVDPELTVSCSQETTAASGLDAFTQLLEAFVSPKSSPIIDALALDALAIAVKSLKPAWENGENIAARAGMSYAAMISGIALANAGLGTVHGFASSVGGFFSIPHGIVCGTLMAECAAVNIKKLSQTGNGAYIKYARVGRLLTLDQNRNNDYYCDLLINTLKLWIEEMKIPRLSAFGVKSEDLSAIVAITENKNNPVILSTDEMLSILEKRL